MVAFLIDALPSALHEKDKVKREEREGEEEGEGKDMIWFLFLLTLLLLFFYFIFIFIQKKGNTGLHLACWQGHLETVKLLVISQADLFAKDNVCLF